MSADRNLWLAIAFGLLVAIALQFLIRLRQRRQRAKSVILELLADGGEWTGLDLIRASGGRLSRGVVYVDLNTLEARGLITSRESAWAKHGIRRRLFRLARKT